MVAAEVLSALPLEGNAANGVATLMRALTDHALHAAAPAAAPSAGTGPHLRVRARTHCDLQSAGPGASDSVLLALAQSLTKDLDHVGPFQLDRRLRRAMRLEQRLDAEIGGRLALVAHEHLHLAQGYERFDDYARERFDLAPRKMRALLRLERVCCLPAPLRDAYRDGRLSWVQTHALLPVLLIEHCRPRTDVWVRWAIQVSVRRLQDDVEQALLLNETDPNELAVTAGLPPAARELIADGGKGAAAGVSARQRQIGAQSTVSAESSRLFFHAPRFAPGITCGGCTRAWCAARARRLMPCASSSACAASCRRF